MAYTTTDIQEVVKIIETSKSNELRVSTVKDKDGVLKALDIRNWYLCKDDETMKPTQKGVRIQQEVLSDVLVALLTNIDEDTKSNLLCDLGDFFE